MCTILGKLDNCCDIARCATVSRFWRSAVAHMRPTSLTIPGLHRPINLTCADQMLQWLQQKHRQGFFRNLRSLSLSLRLHRPADNKSRKALLAGLGLGVLTLAGLWHLETCELQGPFDLGQVALLLPTSLQHLHVVLDPTCTFQIYDEGTWHPAQLSAFQRFPRLQMLHLCGPQIACDCGFELQAGTILGKLQCLYLWPYRLDLDTFADVSLALPSLAHAPSTVSADQAQTILITNALST